MPYWDDPCIAFENCMVNLINKMSDGYAKIESQMGRELCLNQHSCIVLQEFHINVSALKYAQFSRLDTFFSPHFQLV